MHVKSDKAVSKPMGKKVVLLTALDSGGILQFANQMALTLKAMDVPFALFVPVGAGSRCAENIVDNVFEYRLPKFAVPAEKETKKLAADILKMDPGCLIAVDDAIKASAVVGALSKKISCAIAIHDVNPHPQNITLYKFFSETLRKFLARQAYKKADTVVLLSENSYKLFGKQHKKMLPKATVFPLGAHDMPAVPAMPAELQQYGNIDGFALFFGRIDKYKGVDRLIEAQTMNCRDASYDLDVIIAGKNMSNEKLDTSVENKIVCMQRFISDGEMIWLFEHCGVVVLPYYEASQSGVLPIAYKYGKPVIVSDIDGLRELVVENKTGHVFEDCRQLSFALKKYAVDKSGKANPEISDFYKETYDWEKNMKALLGRVLKSDE